MPKPIYDTLKLLNEGAFLDECADKLAEAVKAVKVTITLDLKKAGGAISITAKVTNKAPEPKPDSTLLWPTVEGNLSLNNPAQRDLVFVDVSTNKDPREVRNIDPNTGEILTGTH